MSQTIKTADVIMFMGQSNMAGRGIVSGSRPQTAPKLAFGTGFEYRAVSAPGTLFPLEEPFGVNENREDGINDGSMKTGSMAAAFVKACYEQTHTPVIGISASKGGSSIAQWQPGGAYLNDAAARLRSCRRYLAENEIVCRNCCVLWCQGETDADIGTEKEDYMRSFGRMLEELKREGVEKLFLVSVGRCNVPGEEGLYDSMIAWQSELPELFEDVVPVSKAFTDMLRRGLMKDEFHYYQQGYNECGAEAGKNAGAYLNSIK